MKIKTAAIIFIFLLILCTLPLNAQNNKEVKIGFVSDIGGFNDNNYNQQL